VTLPPPPFAAGRSERPLQYRTPSASAALQATAPASDGRHGNAGQSGAGVPVVEGSRQAAVPVHFVRDGEGGQPARGGESLAL